MKGKPPKISLERIKKALKMSDFFIPEYDQDYVDFIKNQKDLDKFYRLKELVPQLKGVPAKDCLDKIEEFTKLDRELRGLLPVLFIHEPKEGFQQN